MADKMMERRGASVTRRSFALGAATAATAAAASLLTLSASRAFCVGTCSARADEEGEGMGSVDEGPYGGYARRSAAMGQRCADKFETFQVDGRDVFVRMPGAAREAAGTAGAPLVLFMCGTAGDPRGDAAWSGWVDEVDEQGLVLVTPDYDNYATYSQTDFLDDVAAWAAEELPVDASRVYSVGFSNGGAASVAMANDHPERVAAISACGWMVPLRDADGPQTPFQVIQGAGEFTERAADGSVRVMGDERAAIRSLMLRDGLIGASDEADYDAVPYWGYEPDSAWSEEAGGFTWDFSDYYKDRFAGPFAQLVVASDSVHRPRPDEARLAWRFLSRFARVGGEAVEL